MKILSICNRRVLLICLVLFCGVAAVVVGLHFAQAPRKTEGSFFEIAGFSVDDVEKVSVCYQGTTADLFPEDQQRLLDSLSLTTGRPIAFDHEYPYRISDYQIQLHVDGEMIEYPFAWFVGKDGITFVDRRVATEYRSWDGQSADPTEIMKVQEV